MSSSHKERASKRVLHGRQTPLIPSIGVLAMVPDEWSEQWQSRHHILTRLARYFHVVWINPAHGWREAIKGRVAAGASDLLAEQPVGFQVYDERWLPKLYRPRFLAQLTFEQRLQRARRLLVKRGCTKIILYLWRPEFDQALKTVAYDLSCYHVDDEYSFSDSEVPMSDRERRLLAGVDRVFIHSPGLMEKKGWVNPNTSFVPLGVDYEAYASLQPEPSDLAGIPHPRIGYSGWIKKTLDWPLLLQLARQHQEWSFVFVGEAKTDPETNAAIKELGKLRNTYFLGPKSTRELIAYPQHFDVCIMPYRLNDYAQYGYPLKLHEYLASGRPAIGSPMRTLEEFSDMVLLPRTLDQWSLSISKSLLPAANSEEVRFARRRIAQRYDWQCLAARIARAMTRKTRELSLAARPSVDRQQVV